MTTNQSQFVSPINSPCQNESKHHEAHQRSLDRNITSAKKKKATGNHNMLFPVKLRGLLDDAVDEGNEHMISWLPGGNAFKIHDPDLLAEHILKRYFRQNSFKSFTRQLYLYGFVKLENEIGAFGHPSFRRGDMQGCLSINRHNARTHLSSIQDSLKSTSTTIRRAGGDGRYMRNKLLKEANKCSETGTYTMDDIDMESSSFDSDTSSLYEESLTTMDDVVIHRDLNLVASINLISPYIYEHDVIDETVSISETKDWLSLVERNLLVGSHLNEYTSALEPTPISEASPDVVVATHQVPSSLARQQVTSPPFW